MTFSVPSPSSRPLLDFAGFFGLGDFLWSSPLSAHFAGPDRDSTSMKEMPKQGNRFHLTHLACSFSVFSVACVFVLTAKGSLVPHRCFWGIACLALVTSLVGTSQHETKIHNRDPSTGNTHACHILWTFGGHSFHQHIHLALRFAATLSQSRLTLQA